MFINSALHWGGNEKWTLLAAQGLAARGHRVHICCRSPIFRERNTVFSITYHHLHFFNDGDVFTVGRLAYMMRNYSIDVVIPTKVKDYWLGGLAAKLMGRPVAIRLGITRTMRNYWKDRLEYGVLPDKIIVNARAIKEELGGASWVDPSKVEVLYNGVAPAESPQRKDGIRLEFGIGKETFIIGGVGRLAHQKGFDFLLRTFARLTSQSNGCKLIIVGEGRERGTLEDLTKRLNLQGQVIFAGFRKNIEAVIPQLDLLVSSSRFEGVPNVILEAWSCGVPVIATRVPGIEEIINHKSDGFLVEFGDEVGLSRLIQEMMVNSDLRQKITITAKRRVHKEFSLDKMIHDLERILIGLPKFR
ncbi:glycosyltransferase [candidate division KSB1 bacterium]|nr:glycosyltransferase [candidate division KSB1 bacterium]